ncbi:rho GTPase-activating protein SYDE1 isoform X2 [Rhinatrema bivittatum]|uniref:rho GTPase-activating protein SYDE1 isoform X2 n=1 Tax=Rhinatrema bivittatum TaxID=194408 RepID=UPI001126FE9D|nr:rho GTPase-activating protein SYDE1 isoform X2 [Rhinatrema bivittatum]
MYGNVDPADPSEARNLSLQQRCPSESDIYLEEESIYEPIQSTDPAEKQCSSTKKPPRGAAQTPRFASGRRLLLLLSGLLAGSLLMILALLTAGFARYSAISAELGEAQLENELLRNSASSPFLIYNENHNRCVEATHPAALRTAPCDTRAPAQQFQWLSRGRLLHVDLRRCLGAPARASRLLLQLYPCGAGSDLQQWECQNDSLFALKGSGLYLNYGNNKRGVAMLYHGTGPWSRWVIYGTQDDLCSWSCDDRPSKASDADPTPSDPEPSRAAVLQDLEEAGRKVPNITVSRKQKWARVSSSSAREDGASFGRKLLGGAQASPEQRARPGGQGSRLLGQPSDAGKGADQRPSKATSLFRSQSCPQRSNKDRALSSGIHYLRQEEVWTGEKCAEVGFLASSVDDAQSVLGYAELCASSSTAKCSSHGAYLQSLDRSSREWVLSSGKTPGFEDGLRFAFSSIGELKESSIVDDEGDIWYNPIPEEEDLSSLLDKSESWRRHPEVTQLRARGSRTLPNVTNLTMKDNNGVGTLGTSLLPNGATESSCVHAVRCQEVLAEALHSTNPAESNGSQKAETSGPCLQNATGTAHTDLKAPSENRGPVSKGKSPGTVRRLSMKMKKLPELRRKLSLRSARASRQEQSGGSSPPQSLHKESGNVISRYHLDTSVSSRESLWRSRAREGCSKSTVKGGYLSDGDSPELIARTEKGGTRGQGAGEPQAPDPRGGAGPKLDLSAFRPYRASEHPRCVQYLSGLVSVHLCGLQDAKPPRADSRDVFCALQVDGANRAHTALLPCRAPFLALNHTFNLELESSQLLKLVVFSWEPSTCKNRVCCHGTVSLPQVFKGSRCQQLAVKLEPRGLLYAKLTLVEQWEAPPAAAVAGSIRQEPRVFGVELRQLVEREDAAVRVPLLIQKCVSEIEKRGLKVVGLYRLCGSAAVKKELRDAFERDSSAVALSEELYPDINVVTGILKDYLRELPTPLITTTLYKVVLQAMSQRPAGRRASSQEQAGGSGEEAVSLLNCLPEIEKATLTTLLDHLSLVSSFHEYNRMTSQNIAVCFGPVLLNQNQDPSQQGTRSYAHCEEIVNAVDFKRHIEVLHYLLQVWPNPRRKILNFRAKAPLKPASCLRQKEPPQLALDLLESEVVARNRCRGLESPPTNRYAGDWSICGQDYLLVPAGGAADVDYDEVAATDSENEEENLVLDLREGFLDQRGALFVGDFALVDDSEAVDLESPFNPRLNLKDFDALILDLERELSKQINVCL